MASNASLIVTPFKFRAVTSSPRGKCRSIFLTGGSVSIFLRALFSGSSIDIGDLLIRLPHHDPSAMFPSRFVDLKMSRGWGRARRGISKVSDTYQFSFCVSLAIWSSFPSFSVSRCQFVFELMEWSRAVRKVDGDWRSIPKSLMLKTPGTLELALRFSLASDARP